MWFFFTVRDKPIRDVRAMKSKIGSLALLAFIVVLLGTSSAFAITAYLDVSPDRIPPDGTVTIYIENRFETDPITVDYIEVEHADSGATYTKSLGVVLNPGDSITEYFGTGIGGWTPAADTSQEGKYVVTVHGPFKVGAYFDVSDMFSVPELSLPATLVMAIGFALLLGIGSKMSKKRI